MFNIKGYTFLELLLSLAIMTFVLMAYGKSQIHLLHQLNYYTHLQRLLQQQGE